MADEETGGENSRKSKTVIRFVCTKDQASKSLMQNAYNSMEEFGFGLTWFPVDQCLTIEKNNKRIVYVFDEFEGQAFEHLSSLSCRIYGPACLMYCLERDERLPLVSHPLYSMSLSGALVCCTNLLPSIRDELHRRVEYMCGTTSRDYVEQVTHLVAGEAGSKKYAVAATLKRRIMLPDWVEAVWNDCRAGEMVKGDDLRYDKYKCPLFKGFVISASGLDSEERTRIKNIVEANGGRYSGEMKFKECTHLVITSPQGQKYTFALKWHINVVSPDWVTDSVNAGYSLAEVNYPVKDKAGPSTGGGSTSTPTNSRLEGGMVSLSVSSISMTHIDDTTMGRFGANISTQSNNSVLTLASGFTSAISNQAVLSELDALDLKECKSDDFLDNCRIYVDGLTGARMDKIKRIVNLGGGTRLNELMESVTHVVMIGTNDQLVKQLKDSSFRPRLVDLRWVLECFRQGRRVSENSNIVADLTPDINNLANTESSRVGAVKPQAVEQVEGSKLEDEDDVQNLLSQYLPNLNATTGSLGESTMLNAMNDYSENIRKNNNVTNVYKTPSSAANISVNKTPTGHQSVDNDATIDPNDVQNLDDDDATQDVGEEEGNEGDESTGGVFVGMSFVLVDLYEENDQALTEAISQLHGTVLPLSSRKIADYAVVPVFGTAVTVSAVSVVTNFWLQQCVEEQRLIDIQENLLYSPLSIKPDTTPLTGCVLSISGYAGIEREILVHLSGLLGAVCQDYFAKKGKDGLLPSTHLVVNAPTGSKYNAAVRWNLPAVTCCWLYECARTGTRLSEDLFFVNNDTSLEMSSIAQTSSNITKNSSSSTSALPKTSISDDASSNLPPTKTSAFESKSCSENRLPITIDDEVPQKQAEPDSGVFKKPLAALQPKSAERKGARKSNPSEEDTTCGKLGGQTLGVEACEADISLRRSLDNMMGEEMGKNFHEELENDSNFEEMVTPSKGSRDEERLDEVIRQCLSKTNTPVNIRNVCAVKDALVAMETGSTPVGSNRGSASRRDPIPLVIPDKLDLTEVLRLLATPEVTPRTKRRMEEQTRSPSLGELFSRQLALAVRSLQDAASTNQRERGKSVGSQDIDNQPNPFIDNNQEEEERTKPLRGVVVVVSKKLSKNQSDYNALAASLGADYYWMYDDSCTHYIFQGRQNDTNKEFRMARRDGKCIVSPHWLTACSDQCTRVDEGLYPHTYNPDMSLTLLSQKTPGRQLTRSTRKATAAASAADNLDSSPLKSATSGSPVKLAGSSATTAAGISFSPAKAAAVLSPTSIRTAVGSTTAIQSVEGGGEGEGVRDPSSEKSDDNVDDFMSGLKKLNEQALGKKRVVTRSSSFQTPPSGSTSINTSANRDAKGPPGNKSTTTTTGDAVTVTDTQASQAVEITWDDPDARAQWEKLAPDLAINSEPMSPCKRLVQPPVNQTRPRPSESSNKEPSANQIRPHPAVSADRAEVGKSSAAEIKSASNTEATDKVAVVKPTRRVFIFSGLSTADKERYTEVVSRLGGVTIDTSEYTSEATHLIIQQPTRNEKYLACVAAGAWVLHKSYLETSQLQNTFVSESDHEWGGPGTAAHLLGASEQIVKLAAAAFRWRRKLNQGTAAGRVGAFQSWRAVLYTDAKKEANFRRLLEAGGASVIQATSDTLDPSCLTHAFMELAKTKIKVDLSSFAQADVHCIRPDYIASYLMDEPCPHPGSFYIPEILAVLGNKVTKNIENQPKTRGSGSRSATEGKNSIRGNPAGENVRGNNKNGNNNSGGKAVNADDNDSTTATASSRKRRAVTEATGPVKKICR